MSLRRRGARQTRRVRGVLLDTLRWLRAHPRFSFPAVVVVLALAAVAGPPALHTLRIYFPTQQHLPLPDRLISVHSALGKQFLRNAGATVDYPPLRRNFVRQQHGSYCGVASSVIALNALAIGDGNINQDNFFTPQAEQVRSEDDVFYGGMTLAELAALLQVHGANARAYYAEEVPLARFRDIAVANLLREGDVVLVNFQRRVLGQTPGGHISPIAAYDAVEDRFLLLDTATYKYPAAWVAAVDLWRAMNTIDKDAGRSRGFVTVGRP